jgi:WD40 repeat protein
VADAPASTEPKYWAFISYSHRDERWARWLHRGLETYRGHKRLVGTKTAAGDTVPSRVFPVFRDRDDLAGAPHLSESIEQALRSSRFLIVLCSTSAAKSIYVDREIRRFKALGRERHVLALIVNGEPHGPAECFPEALKFEVATDGALTATPAEPIAADARPGKDGRRGSLLKILAGVLGVAFDDLRQRDQARRMRALATVAVASLLGLIVVATLAVTAYRERNEAIRQGQIALARQLAAQSELALADPRRAREGLDLAVNATAVLERQGVRLFDVDSTLRRAMDLAPRAFRAAIQAPGRTSALATVDGGGGLLRISAPTDAGDGQGRLRLQTIDVATGAPRGPPRDLAAERLVRVLDDRFLAYEADGQLRVRDLRSDEVIASLESSENLLAVDVTRGRLVVAAENGVEVRQTTPPRLIRLLPNPQVPSGTLSGPSPTTAIAASFSTDGQQLAVGYRSTAVRAARVGSLVVWNLATGQPSSSFNAPSPVTTVSYLPRDRLVWGDAGQTNVGIGPRVSISSGAGDGVAVNPEGTLVATSEGGLVRLWSVPAREEEASEEIWRLSEGDGPVALHFGGEGGGAWLATAAASGPIRLWRTSNRAAEQRAAPLPRLAGDLLQPQFVAFSPDRKLVVAVSHDPAAVSGPAGASKCKGVGVVSTFQVFDADRGTPVSKAMSACGPFINAALPRDGGVLMAASQTIDPVAIVWDRSTGTELARTPLATQPSVTRVVSSPDGQTVGLVFNDHTLSLWRWREPGGPKPLAAGVDLAFDPTRDELAYVAGQTVWFRDVAGRRPAEARLTAREPMRGVAFSADGAFLATRTDGGPVWIWQLATGQQAGLVEHLETSGNLAFDAKGMQLMVDIYSGESSSAPWGLPLLLDEARTALAALPAPEPATGGGR